MSSWLVVLKSIENSPFFRKQDKTTSFWMLKGFEKVFGIILRDGGVERQPDDEGQVCGYQQQGGG